MGDQMKGNKTSLKEWMKINSGKLFVESDSELVESILSKGTTFHCNVLECSHLWKGRAKEVYLSCPKCGKKAVSFHLKKIDRNTLGICRTTDWDQEDM